MIMTRNLFILTILSVLLSSTMFAQNGSGQGQINFQNSSTSILSGGVISKAQYQNGSSLGVVSTDSNSADALGEKCLEHDRDEALKILNPQFRAGRESAIDLSRRIVQELNSGVRATPPVYTIPIVFHVIHKGESVGSGTNVSSAQLQSSVDALNRDYRRTSVDGGIALGAGPDTEIQFCLASIDPNGNATTGINRINGTSVSGYASNGITSANETSVKALSRWDNQYYLNIWVVSEIDGNGADLSNPANFTGGTLGYAYLPTNPVTWNSDRDGVVILNLCVGNDPNQSNGYRLWPWGSLTNRAVTHEVGHYLGLDHPFEGNSCSENAALCHTLGDRVCDTPPTVQGSTCNTPACPGALVENYMDYTSETCQDMFTSGQSVVMRAALAGARNAVVNTSNCGAPNDYDAAVSAIAAPNGSICLTTFTPSVTLTNYGATTLTSVQIAYNVDATGPSTYNWTGSLAQNASTSVTLDPVTTTTGAHTFTATTVSGTLNTNNTDQETNNDESTSSFTIGASGAAITLTLDLDCYGDEITWEVRNSSNTVVTSGGPYVNNASGEQITESLCLAEGCYDFIINDSYGDGLYGSQHSGCNVDGDYEITDSGGGILVELTAANSDFGTSATHNFCIGGGGSSTTCEVLMAFDGYNFSINNNDLPNFGIEIIDNDQEAVATPLANNDYTSDWMGFYEIPTAPDTNFYVGVTSWFADTTQYADNWLNFGQVTIPNDGGELRWKHRFPNNSYRDGYEVLVNFNGTSISDFSGATVLYTVDDNDPSTNGDTDWTSQVVDLPSGTYAGQTIYIAFHHTALNMFFLELDEIEVEGCTSTLVGISEGDAFKINVFPNPSSSNFTFKYATDSNEKLNFSLHNSVGQSVWSHQSSNGLNGEETIETGGLSAGIYTLVVQGETFNVSKKLILTH